MILVVGATGHLGGLITRRLLAQGEQVRVLVRPDASYWSLERAGCEPTIGDIKYPESFGPAFNGIKTVITTASARDYNIYDSYDAIDLAGNRNLIDAAKAAGVQQFVFVSALGTDVEHPDPFYRAKGQTEAYLRVSGLNHTILASTLYMDPWMSRLIDEPLRDGQPATVIGSGKRRHSFIALQDVAAFAASVVGHPEALNRTIAIGGPEAFTWLDVVAQVGGELGQPIPVNHYEKGADLPGLSHAVSRVAVNFEAFDYVLDMTATAARYGVTLTPLQTVIQQMFGQPIR